MDTTTQPAGIMREMLEPITDRFSADSPGTTPAQLFASIEATPAMVARLEVLGEKCNEGELTPNERTEYETYVQVGDLFAILKAKAKKALAQDS